MESSEIVVFQDLNNCEGVYLILLTSPAGLSRYDDWVENIEALKRYFEELKWNIAWQENE